MKIRIENDGSDIRDTNYWATDIGRWHSAYSMNAGCLRVLIPRAKEHWVSEMTACDYALVSTIANPRLDRVGIEILFEDHSESPFCLLLAPGAGIGFYPMVEAEPVEGSLSLWIKGPKKVGTMRAFFRKVPGIPYLKPL